MYRAGVCSILSQLAREDRLAVVESFGVDAPKTKLLAQKVKGMGFDDVLIITDSVGRQPATCRRATCPTCWCWKPRRGRSGEPDRASGTCC